MRTLKFLPEMVQHWIEMNYLAQFNVDVWTSKHGASDASNSQEGSEISKDRQGLTRAIKGYENFAQVVQSGLPFNSSKFLPQIPLVDRNLTSSQVGYLGMGRGETMLLAPHFLSNWFRSKKVFEMKHSSNIAFADPYQENYLKHLPGNNFILTIDTPLFAEPLNPQTGTRATPEFGFKEFFVSSVDGILEIFAVPSSMKDFLLPKQASEIISHIKKLIKDPKRNKALSEKRSHELVAQLGPWHKKQFPFLFLRMKIESGALLAMTASMDGFTEIDYLDYKTKVRQAGETKEEVLAYLQKSFSATSIPFFINGMCKVLATFSPDEIRKINVEEIGDIEIDEKPIVVEIKKPAQSQQWFEVPASNVSSADITDVVLKKIKKKDGGKKNEHFRMPTIRKYKSGVDVFVTAMPIKGYQVSKDQIEKVNRAFKEKHKIL